MTDGIGLIAAMLVLATFSMKTMIWLRLTAVASNLAFIWYGLEIGLVPIWALHAVLLPINLWKIGKLLAEQPMPGFGRFSGSSQQT
ncbi:MAG: hypothetical protein AAGB15_10485 [Pseudomonadota bacterium]